ncbi:hypothetical protein SEPCBS119000_005768 [Sporothrix epigloea]|uniref:Uncharacterized protein n=1 Tax=Sporothrix epigloea TaxID=1892477 RepID=A0ABP0E2U7_9PEZI
MASDLMWDHHFCLTCDKQTDGPAYCSESCRLADYEGANCYAPPAGSGLPYSSQSSTSGWTLGAAPSSRSRQLFSLSPTYDASRAQPYHGPASTGSAGPYNYNRLHASSNNTSSSSSSRFDTRRNPIYTSASTSMLSLPPTTSSTSATTSVTYHHVLSPSSSHSSLSSMQSGTSITGSGAMSALSAYANGTSSGTIVSPNNAGTQTAYGSAASNSSDISEKVRSELRKYTNSFEQAKLQRQLQRRRSC